MLEDLPDLENEGLRFWEIVAFGAYFLGILAIAVFSYSEGSWKVFGVLWIVGTAAWLAGTVIGFLFGVPKVRTEETAEDVLIPEARNDGAGETQGTQEQPSSDGSVEPPIATADYEDTTQRKAPKSTIVPNTNLEQISDWLTKIIVGATLVQLEPLARGIGELSIFVGNSIGTGGENSAGAVAAGGIMVFYFSAGFIWGYLWCSLRIFREMQKLVAVYRDWRRLTVLTGQNRRPGGDYHQGRTGSFSVRK